MSDLTKAPTTMSNIGVAMFTVTDQDAAIAFYTEKLGFELRADTAFGENGEMPLGRGGAARLDRPPRTQPADGRSARRRSHRRRDAGRPRRARPPYRDRRHRPDPEPMRRPGPDAVHAARPDGNDVAVVEAPPAA